MPRKAGFGRQSNSFFNEMGDESKLFVRIQKIGESQFEEQISTLLCKLLGEDFDAALKANLVNISKDLATARERLIHYETQLGRQN